MKAEDLGTPEELSATHMIENSLGDLEPNASDLAVTTLEAGEEA